MDAYTTLSDVYDELMSDVAYDDWTDYILKLMARLGAPDDASILDVGCGTGSIAIALKKFGFDVTGLDIAADMLRIAEEKARKAGVDMPFICQPLTEINLHKKVDVIIASCDVVNYITPSDIEVFFSAVYSNLNDDGIFIFDISSDYKLRNVLGNNIFFEDREALTYIWVNHLDNDKLTMDLTLFKRQDNLFLRSDEQHTQFIHNNIKIIKNLKRLGFVNAKAYDCFSFKEPTIKSERIQFAAKKG